MSPERWQKIQELFEAALEYPAEERAAFLARACASDEEIQRRVEAMLAADARDDLLLDRPAFQLDSPFVSSALLRDDSQSFSGEMIGVYRLIKELGRGGMGAVYLAYDTRLGRHAALKLLPSHLVNNPERVHRFQREARTVSALNHPNIITIYDFGHEKGRDYIASEFVEGCTLRDCVGNPEFSLRQICDVVIQVASALEAAHTAGIVHRDIKPENIMLRPDGYVKVLDFGLAKLTEPDSDSNKTKTDASTGSVNFETRTGMVLGTINYMSPEQARGQKVDWRSDLFSLGVILYELITGNRPFSGKTWHHTIVAITDAEPPPLTLDSQFTSALQKITDRVLAKEREQRYQTARELIVDLQAVQVDLAADLRIQRSRSDLTQDVPAADERGSGTTRGAAITGKRAHSKMNGMNWLLAGLRQHRQLIAMTSLILVTAAAYFYFGRQLSANRPALTDKDTILLTDFVNTTGDAVFDDTLKHGLMVQLGQSPYFNLLPDERARETMRLMERPPDEKITRELGREICQRRGIKALLVGAIASLGRNYVITLEAINSQTGEAIAYQQVEAEGKEQVLKSLGRVSTAMREKLGESLASIRKYDAPIEQATTPSLEALKDYTIGAGLRGKGQYAQAILPFKRAVERDHEFALAYLHLGTSYRDLRQLALGNQYLVKAYQLRNRVSERERLEISATYFRHITGELDKRIETSARLTQTYPQNTSGYHIHGNSLMVAGEYEQAAEAYRGALRLDADYSLSRANLALALIALNRFDEAQEVIQQGLARHLDSGGFRNRLYLTAFLKGDAQAMRHQVEWFAGKPDEYQMREIQGRSLAFAGRRREASEIFTQAAALAEARGLLLERARILANVANLNAILGLTQLAKKQTTLVLTTLEKDGIAHEELMPSLIQQLDSQPVAWTLALCGEAARAQSLSDTLAHRLPLDTIYNSVWLPMIRATLELKRGLSAKPERAIQLLQPARQYEAAIFFKPVLVRGEAYLQAGNGALAAAEFQRIIEHRGWDMLSPLWPLAHLGLARAAALQGDVAKSRQSYEEFFRLWSGADADLPVLTEAKKEYAKLN